MGATGTCKLFHTIVVMGASLAVSGCSRDTLSGESGSSSGSGSGGSAGSSGSGGTTGATSASSGSGSAGDGRDDDGCAIRRCQFDVGDGDSTGGGCPPGGCFDLGDHDVPPPGPGGVWDCCLYDKCAPGLVCEEGWYMCMPATCTDPVVDCGPLPPGNTSALRCGDGHGPTCLMECTDDRDCPDWPFNCTEFLDGFKACLKYSCIVPIG